MMILSDRKIRYIIEYFDIGELDKVFTTVKSGFQSDNYHIRTNKGDYMLRYIYDTVENVEYIMGVFIPDWIVGWPEWLPEEGLGLN